MQEESEGQHSNTYHHSHSLSMLIIRFHLKLIMLHLLSFKSFLIIKTFLFLYFFLSCFLYFSFSNLSVFSIYTTSLMKIGYFPWKCTNLVKIIFIFPFLLCLYFLYFYFSTLSVLFDFQFAPLSVFFKLKSAKLALPTDWSTHI